MLENEPLQHGTENTKIKRNKTFFFPATPTNSTSLIQSKPLKQPPSSSNVLQSDFQNMKGRPRGNSIKKVQFELKE